MNKTINKHAPSIAGIAISASWLFNFLNIGVSSIYVSKQIYMGMMTVGDFTSVISAINNLSNNFLQYSNILPEFKRHALFIENYIEVLNIESEIYCKKGSLAIFNEDIENINLKNIYFNYPNTYNVLKDINLNLKQGNKIAFMSCVKDMDVIYYIDNGAIIEYGTHLELMNLNGKYAETFRLQAKRYGDV